MKRPALRALFQSPSGRAASFVLLTLALISVLAPIYLSDSASSMNIGRSGEPPSWDYPLGTDALGRPILSRILVATGLSISLAIAATLVAAITGIGIGVGVALLRPRWRAVGLRTIDVILSFPGILLAIVITSIVGIGIEGAIIAIGLAYAPDFARLASTLAISVTGRDYVAAARTIGVSRWGQLRHYILPNIGETMIVAVFATSAATLIAVSSLSFLGLGVQPPQYDWGRLLVEGIESFYFAPAAALASSFMIGLTGLALGFFGEALARTTNPMLWSPQQSMARKKPAVANRESAPPEKSNLVLDVQDLTVSYPGAQGASVRVIDGVSLQVSAGEIVGIVGESGSGKSQTAMAIAGLLEQPADVSRSAHHFAGHDLISMPSDERNKLLGSRLALVFQDPMTSLNPTLALGPQVAEPALLHLGKSRAEALALAVNRLREVGIPSPESRLGAFPHEMSGGMQQRSMIAMGLMNEPALLIADEPTTALDVTIQAQVVELLKSINQKYGTAILLISHNLGVVASIAQRVVVMYAGKIIEDAPAERLMCSPAHPYTKLLLAATPQIDGPLDQPLAAIEGYPPPADERPEGCAFAPRCPKAQERCMRLPPALANASDGHLVACHFPMTP